MQALLASYHALVHFLATALLLFVLYIRAFIYIFYVIHYSNPVAPSLVTQNISCHEIEPLCMKLESESVYDFKFA